jgi:calnexin
MLIDTAEVNSGSLLVDLSPPINPSKEIVDPNDKRPENWDDRAKIPDASAVKPDDWDETLPKQIPDENARMPDDWLENEPDMVPDPDAVRPDDWDDDTDGKKLYWRFMV